MPKLTTPALLACAALVAWTACSTAQTPTIKRTPLQKFDVPSGSYETVLGMAEISPSAHIGRHSHFGVEAGYVAEGSMTLLVDGQPPLVLKAGQSYMVPAGAIHDAAAESTGVKVVATYVVEKGKPLATPAP